MVWAEKIDRRLNMQKNKHDSVWPQLKRLLPFAKPYTLWGIMALAVSLVNVAVDILLAHFTKNLINASLNSGSLLRGTVCVFAIILVGAAAWCGGVYFNLNFIGYTLYDLRKYVYSHIEALPARYMEDNHSGGTISRFTNDVLEIQRFMHNYGFATITQPALLLSAFTYLLFINWKLLLFSTIIMPGAFWLGNILNKPISKYYSQLQEQLGKANAVSQDVLSGISISKAFNLNEELNEKYLAAVNETVKKNMIIQKKYSMIVPISIILRMTPLVLCIMYGGYLAVNGRMAVGELLAFMMLLGFITAPMSIIPHLMYNLRRVGGAINHLFEILDVPIERTDGEVFNTDDTSAPVEFRDISFSYDNKTKVFSHLSLKLPKGKMTALVGSSGSGKSTVFKLLCGFYQAQEGSIELYGHDLGSWNLAAARAQLSLVSQDTYLFPATVTTNISYGRPDATMDEIISAAKAANAHDFIMELPNGYDTPVGERGIRLSGGQKQRIAIARAVLKDAQVLLLDEPTSALDTQSEALVQDALEHIMQNRTVLVIAHRLSTIKDADEVLVLENGCIVENGTHEELMNKSGVYRQLYLKQFATQTAPQSDAEEESA